MKNSRENSRLFKKKNLKNNMKGLKKSKKTSMLKS